MNLKDKVHLIALMISMVLVLLEMIHVKDEKVDLFQQEDIKVHLHWAKAKFLIWFLSLLNVNIKLDSLWTYLETMSLSPQY